VACMFSAALPADAHLRVAWQSAQACFVVVQLSAEGCHVNEHFVASGETQDHALQTRCEVQACAGFRLLPRASWLSGATRSSYSGWHDAASANAMPVCRELGSLPPVLDADCRGNGAMVAGQVASLATSLCGAFLCTARAADAECEADSGSCIDDEKTLPLPGALCATTQLDSPSLMPAASLPGSFGLMAFRRLLHYIFSIYFQSGVA
jgi:hypothetical protein